MKNDVLEDECYVHLTKETYASAPHASTGKLLAEVRSPPAIESRVLMPPNELLSTPIMTRYCYNSYSETDDTVMSIAAR